MAEKLVDVNRLKKLSKLARIEVPEQEQQKMIDLLNGDISFVKAVYDIDTEGLEALVNPVELPLREYKDEITDGDKQEQLMACSNKSMYGYYTVPKIMEN